MRDGGGYWGFVHLDVVFGPDEEFQWEVLLEDGMERDSNGRFKRSECAEELEAAEVLRLRQIGWQRALVDLRKQIEPLHRSSETVRRHNRRF